MTSSPDWLTGPGEPGLVSVVIPTYNRAYILGAAIQSALDQTYQPVEVIVADDGSRDGTAELVKAFDARVRYIRQENAGVSAARNTGMRNARGEFVALLDSDDQWLPWKLEAQVAVLRRFPEAGMVWTDMVAIDEQGRHLSETYLRQFYVAHRKIHIEAVLQPGGTLAGLWPGAPAAVASRPLYAGELFASMLLGNLVHTSTVLLRRSRLAQVGGFDLSLKRSGEDYEFHLRTTSFGPVAFLDASSILYRVGAADQLTAPEYTLDMARNNLETVQRWLAQGGTRITLPRRAVRARLAESYAWVGEQELLAGASHDSRRHLWRSVRLDPANPHRVMALLCTFLPSPVFLAANRGRKALRALVGLTGAGSLLP
ncbi:MAG TPA: glycosyltransferase family 2 protein [Gemmatimonadales bacterium]|nr:glycosyltransferase family 2 protein [Gemmatimonadales bacterium]